MCPVLWTALILSTLYRCASKEENEDGVINGLAVGMVLSLFALFITGLFATSPAPGEPILFTRTTGFFIGIFGLLVFGIPALRLCDSFDSDKFSFSAALVTYILTSFAIFGFGYALILGLYAPSLFLVIVIVIAEEVLFWLDDQPRPSDTGVMTFTILKKCEALIDLGAGLGIAEDIIMFFKYSGTALSDIETALKTIAPALQYIAIETIIVLGGAGFIYANSLKYRKGKKNNGESPTVTSDSPAEKPSTSVTPSTNVVGSTEETPTRRMCRGCGGWRYASQSKCPNCGRP